MCFDGGVRRVVRIPDDVYEVVMKGIEKVKMREKDSEDRKTCDEVFDKGTLLAIYKLICDGYFKILDFPISTGKEGNVFRAVKDDGTYVAVKIYRVSTLTFRSISRYIYGDPRFRGTKRRRLLIATWAKKEFKNLMRARDAGVRVPRRIRQWENVLVMEYIGDDIGPAPLIKDVDLDDPERYFEILKNAIRNLYVNGKMVHGDISEYNVMVFREEPVIIDWAQGVVIQHPMAMEWLRRDIRNILRYFSRIGVKVPSEEDMMRFVVGG